jgi:hypothetical protein
MPATIANLCPECGSAPGDCYNLCPLSPVFYSPEMEREDEANWSRADYDREVYGDPDLYDYPEPGHVYAELPCPASDFAPSGDVFDPSDIPF